MGTSLGCYALLRYVPFSVGTSIMGMLAIIPVVLGFISSGDTLLGNDIGQISPA